MATANYAVTTLGSGILKNFYEGAVREQLNSETVLMKRLVRNTKDIQGGRAIIALHSGRNPNVGARAAGAKLPLSGNQTIQQATTDMRHQYGQFTISGPDIARTKGNKGAFAKLIDTEVKGLKDDLKNDMNRQMFADGSGFMCFATNTATTTTAGIVDTVAPYLWSPATKYMQDNMEIQACDFSATGASLLIASTDTDSTAYQVVKASCTSTVGSTNALVYDTGAFGTAYAAGDGIGRWRSVMYLASNTAVRYEMMGLDGIVHPSDLIGDANWYYGNYSTALGTWTSPEIAGTTYDWGLSGGTNNLQGVDAVTYDFWRAECDDNSGVRRALSLSLLDNMKNTLEVTNGGSPSLVISTAPVRTKYVDLLRQDRRYVNTMTLDGGFSAVEYMGLPWVVDKDCPSGRLYMLDESSLQLYVGEDFGFIEDGGGSVLHARIDSGFDAYTSVLRWFGELCCTRRNVNGKIIDIQE